MCLASFLFVFFNDTATTEIYTLFLHDALPISSRARRRDLGGGRMGWLARLDGAPARGGTREGGERSERSDGAGPGRGRSEEHTSELQSRQYLVCRLLLEKKKKVARTAIATESV